MELSIGDCFFEKKQLITVKLWNSFMFAASCSFFFVFLIFFLITSRLHSRLKFTVDKFIRYFIYLVFDRLTK